MFELSKTFIKLSKIAKSLILEDASNGVFQNEDGRVGKFQYSVGYREFRKSKGKDTSFVDARFTGDMLRRITSVPEGNNGFKLVYAEGGKVRNMERLRYSVLGLNNKNLNKVENIINKELNLQITNYTAKPTTIQVGK